MVLGEAWGTARAWRLTGCRRSGCSGFPVRAGSGSLTRCGAWSRRSRTGRRNRLREVQPPGPPQARLMGTPLRGSPFDTLPQVVVNIIDGKRAKLLRAHSGFREGVLLGETGEGSQSRPVGAEKLEIQGFHGHLSSHFCKSRAMLQATGTRVFEVARSRIPTSSVHDAPFAQVLYWNRNGCLGFSGSGEFPCDLMCLTA